MKSTYQNGRITLDNGVQFLQSEGEPNEDFKQRVIDVIDRDYCEELIIKDLTPPQEPVSQGAPTDTLIEDEAIDAPYLNKGKVCSFEKRLTGEEVQGQIIWVYLDKRKDLLYYRVKEATGKLHIVRTNNPTLNIF